MSAISATPFSFSLSAPISMPTSLGPQADDIQCAAVQAPAGQLPGNYCYYPSTVSKQLSDKCCAQYVSEPVQTDDSGCFDYCSFGNNLLLMGNPMEYYKDCMSEETDPVCITKQPPSHSDFAPDASATASTSRIASATVSPTATSTTTTAPALSPAPGNSSCSPDHLGNPTGWTPESFCYTSVEVPKQKMRQCCSKITSGLVRTDESGCYSFCPMDDGKFHSESKYDQMAEEWSQCMSDSNAAFACQQTNRDALPWTLSSAVPTMAVSSTSRTSSVPTPTASGQDNAAGKVGGNGWSLKAMGAMLGAAVVFGLQI